MRTFLYAVVTLLLLLPATSTAAVEGQVVGVVDGDTLDIQTGSRTLRIDLAGIDCPEEDQPHGEEARQAVTELAYLEQVNIRILGQNRFGQASAHIVLEDGRVLSAELLRRGLAWWDSAKSESSELARLEREARAARRGLWSSSSPVAPWEWRAQVLTRALQNAEPKPEERSRVTPTPPQRNCRPRSECCKVCRKGKACGNSCISRSYNCHKGRGCACDSWELC